MNVEKLKRIEESLHQENKTFGIIYSGGYYDPSKDEDIIQYFLITSKESHGGDGWGKCLLVGEDWVITEDTEASKIDITVEEIIEVFNIFRRNHKELIIDLQRYSLDGDLSDYIERIKALHINLDNGLKKYAKVYVTNIKKDELVKMTDEISLHRVICDCTVEGSTQTNKEVCRIFSYKEYEDVSKYGYYFVESEE